MSIKKARKTLQNKEKFNYDILDKVANSGLIISSVPPPAAAVFFLFLLFSFSAFPSACTGGRSLLDRLFDKEGGKEYKYVGLDQAVKNIKVKAEGHRQRHRKQDLDQFHDDKRSQHVSE